MSTFSITRAFVSRDWAETRSYRLAFVLGLVDTVLRLAVFFYIAKLVDTGSIDDPDLSEGYFAFAVVGLALTEILNTGLTSIAVKLREEQFSGTLEIVMAAPIRNRALVSGMAAFEFLRAIGAGVLLVVAAVVVFGLDLNAGPADYLALIPALLASLGLFVAIGIGLAAATVVYKRTTSLTSFVTEILAVLGGVYFPLSVLPGPLEAVGNALPFTWAVDLVRGILIQGEVQAWRLAALAVCALVALPVSAWLFVIAVRRARADGSLVEY